jgi:hypothetical protein
MSPEMKTTEGWGLLELRDGTRKIDKQSTYSHGPAQNQTTS